MNKKTFITMMLALVAMTGQAQEIKMNWYDAEDKVTRCCGSISDIIKRSPHYYILGIKYY